MIQILHYLNDPRLWEIRYLPYYGYCRIYIINLIGSFWFVFSLRVYYLGFEVWGSVFRS